MADKPYASLTVNFGEAALADGEGSISLELDDELNGEDSNFDFGEKVHIRCFTFPVDLPLGSAQATDGSVSGPTGTGTLTVTDEVIQFQNGNSANPSKPITTLISSEWVGKKTLGSISVQADGSIRASQSGTAVLKISYTSTYRKIQLTVTPPSPLPDDQYPVIVYVEGA